jgi:hypothetical protein
LTHATDRTIARKGGAVRTRRAKAMRVCRGGDPRHGVAPVRLGVGAWLGARLDGRRHGKVRRGPG